MTFNVDQVESTSDFIYGDILHHFNVSNSEDLTVLIDIQGIERINIQFVEIVTNNNTTDNTGVVDLKIEDPSLEAWEVEEVAAKVVNQLNDGKLHFTYEINNEYSHISIKRVEEN